MMASIMEVSALWPKEVTSTGASNREASTSPMLKIWTSSLVFMGKSDFWLGSYPSTVPWEEV